LICRFVIAFWRSDIVVAVMIALATFHEACANNNIEVVIQAIDANPRIAYQSEPKQGKVGLHIACTFGAYEVCKVMIDRLIASSDGRRSYLLELKDWEKKTALHYACEHNYIDIVKLLVQANIGSECWWVSGPHDHTPLQLAISGHHLEVCKYMTPIMFQQPSCLPNKFKIILSFAFDRGFISFINWLVMEWKGFDCHHGPTILRKRLQKAVLGQEYPSLKKFLAKTTT